MSFDSLTCLCLFFLPPSLTQAPWLFLAISHFTKIVQFRLVLIFTKKSVCSYLDHNGALFLLNKAHLVKIVFVDNDEIREKMPEKGETLSLAQMTSVNFFSLSLSLSIPVVFFLSLSLSLSHNSVLIFRKTLVGNHSNH